MDTLPITRIQRFSTQDGPGIRTTVFMKGCPLRCQWCHNPETQSPLDEFFFSSQLCLLCGACSQVCPEKGHRIADECHTIDRSRCIRCMACTEICPAGALEKCRQNMTPDEILDIVLRDKSFYGKSGGVTLSGGECMLHGEKTLHLLELLKAHGLHTCVETCGCFDEALLPDLCRLSDLILWDIKDTDSKRHQQYTGVPNEKILQNLLSCDQLGGKTQLQCILVNGVNLSTAHLDGIAALYNRLAHCRGVHLFPCHALGESKETQLGRSDPFPRSFVPDGNAIRDAKTYLRSHVRLIP